MSGVRASVVIPTLDGGALFGDTLSSVLAQEAPFAFEVIVIDSGSRDGTAQRARKAGVRVHEIDQRTFDHGATRRWGAELSAGEYVAYLTQDATPADALWLARLVAALDRDPRVAGAYSRQLPRPDTDPIAAANLRGWIAGRDEPYVRRIASRAEYDALSPWQRRLFANFDDVASCVRKSVLAKHPYEDAAFGEDLLWSRRVLEAGHSIAYVPESSVHHCHPTAVAGKYRRTLNDHLAMGRIFGLDYFEETFSSSVSNLALGVAQRVVQHAGVLSASDVGPLAKARWLATAAAVEVAVGLAYVRASRALPRAAPSSKGRPLLFVTHDFPPEQAGGTAVYTYRLAREIAKRRDVTVFHRSTDPSRSDYDVKRRFADGVTVVSMNRFDQGTKASVLGVRDERAERIFEDVLGESRAELVHFQYLGSGIPASFLEIAERRGVPTVVTLQDYWGLCPRGQMMSNRWELCARAVPSACSACVTGAYMPVSVLLERHTGVVDLANADAVAKADVTAPAPDYVGAAGITVEGVHRRWLVAHPPARIVYRLRLTGDARVSFLLAMAPDTWTQPGEGVRFTIASREGASEKRIFERYLDPKSRPEDRSWIEAAVDLEGSAAREVELVFETAPGPAGDSAYCTAGWGELSVTAAEGERAELLDAAPRTLGGDLRAAAGRWLAGTTRVSESEIEERSAEVLRRLSGAGRILAPSAFLKEMFVRHGLDASRVAVSDYGFETEGFSRGVRTPGRRPVFGYMGTWMATKGLHVLVDAFLGLPEGVAELRLHGYAPNPNHDEYVRWLTARIAGRSDVKLMGRYAPEDAARVLSEIDVLVVPSIWHENSPLTIHEAFAAGVPVVTSDIGGMAELVRDGESGLLFRVGDVVSLRRALGRLVEERGLVEKLAAGVPQVKTIEGNARELEEIYSRLGAGASS